MQEPSAFGQYYWCVKIQQVLSERSEGTLSDTTEMYLFADVCTVLPSGALEFRRVTKAEQTGEQVNHITLALAPGEWICVYTADLENGHALAVES